MSRIKRKIVAFNEDDAHQRELLEWCAIKSSNFSGFIKDVLCVYKAANGLVAAPVSAESYVAVAQTNEANTGGSGNILDIL